MKKYTPVIFLGLVLLLILGGCAQEKKVASPEEIVRKVMDDYTQAAVKNDFQAMYELLSPEDKATISKEEYLRRQEYREQKSDVVLKGGKIKEVQLSKKQALVKMELQTEAPHAIPSNKVLVYRDSHWYVALSPDNKKELGIGKTFEDFQKEF